MKWSVVIAMVILVVLLAIGDYFGGWTDTIITGSVVAFSAMGWDAWLRSTFPTPPTGEEVERSCTAHVGPGCTCSRCSTLRAALTPTHGGHTR